MTQSSRTIKASFWTLSGKLLSRVFDLVLLLIFSRILTPEDFGLVALAMAPIYVGEALLSMPLAQTLLRIKKPADNLYDTAFTLSVIRGLAYAIIFVAISVPLANFYGEPRLTALICALAIAPIFRGTQSPYLIVFMKNLDFRREFALDIFGKAVGFTVAVILVLRTESYWAIAAMTIVTTMAMNFLSYVLAPYRPRLTLQGWHEFADMIGWNSVSQLLIATNAQMARILLGRFVPAGTLGQYAISEDLLSIPVKSVVMPLKQPLMANYSIQPDNGALVKAFGMTQNTMLSIMTPVFLAFSILAAPIVFVIFGNKWMEAAPILQWLALTWILPLILMPVNPLALSLDKTRYNALLAGIEVAIKIPAMLFGIYFFGIWGAIAAIFLGGLIATIASFFVVRKLIGLSIWKQLIAVSRPLIAAIFMAIVMWISRPEISADLSDSKLLIIGSGLLCGILGLTTYLATLFLTWRIYGRPFGIEVRLVEMLKSRMNLIRRS
jgi:O-antigen/teichoic acid export membrane protein